MPYGTTGARTRKRKRSFDTPAEATIPLAEAIELQSSKKAKTEFSGGFDSAPEERNRQTGKHSKRRASSSSRSSRHILRSITRK